MGMFDTVWVNCPDCSARVEFQTKAGECVLQDFSLADAPVHLLADIANDINSCPVCHRSVGVRLTVVAVAVPV